MAVSLGSNISSLNVLRYLGEATRALGSATEKLSSGLRINRASDDAAGLSVAMQLNASARIYTQSIRNINDGVSLLSIANSSVGELSKIITRLSELAEQAANGTYSTVQRVALDNEAQALRGEFHRVVETTSFNGIELFSTDSDEIIIQAGDTTSNGLLRIGPNNLELSIAGLGTFSGSATISGSNYSTLYDLNNDGILDIHHINFTTDRLYVLLGNGNGTFLASKSSALGSNPAGRTVADFNGDGILDFMVGDDTGGVFAHVYIGNGNGTFQARVSYTTTNTNGASFVIISSNDYNGDGFIDVAMSDNGGNTNMSVLFGNGNGTFKAGTAHFLGSTAGMTPTLYSGDFNNDGRVDVITNRTNGIAVSLGNGNGTFIAPLSYQSTNISGFVHGDLNNDGINDVYTLSASNNSIGVMLGNSSGSFKAQTNIATPGAAPGGSRIADFNNDGNLDLMYTATSGTSIDVMLGNGNGTFKAALSTPTPFATSPEGQATGDLNGDGVIDMIANDTDTDRMVVMLANTETNSYLPSFSLRTSSGALAALDSFKSSQAKLGSALGRIGAQQSRLLTASAVIQAQRDEFISASSRISDADVAQESANVIRGRILQQISTSILAQANQEPTVALSILKNS